MTKFQHHSNLKKKVTGMEIKYVLGLKCNINKSYK